MLDNTGHILTYAFIPPFLFGEQRSVHFLVRFSGTLGKPN